MTLKTSVHHQRLNSYVISQFKHKNDTRGHRKNKKTRSSGGKKKLEKQMKKKKQKKNKKKPKLVEFLKLAKVIENIMNS